MSIQRLLARGSDVVVVNGAAQVELVRELYHVPANRAVYVPLSPPFSATKWATRKTAEEHGTVLFFGEAYPRKGLQYLIQAQPAITERVPHARILIASRGREVERCRQMIQDCSKFVINEGFVSGHEMAALFQQASLVVLPYLSASTSGILMMAFVFGKPVVATRAGVSAGICRGWFDRPAGPAR